MTKRAASARMARPATKSARRAQSGKVGKVMHEYKAGHLHSGSKHGPVVHSRKQAIAIALHEAARHKKR